MGLPKDLRRILWMSSVFLVIFTFMGIFVNLYIWERHQSIAELCWYNIVLFMAWGVGFTTGAGSLTRFSCRVPMRLSALSGLAAFVVLCLVHVRDEYLWIALVAIPAGLFGGFYYSGQNLSIIRLGRGEEFSAFYFYQNLINQVVGLVNPLLFALFIHWFGYGSSFLLMMLFVCVMFALSFLVPPITYKQDVGTGGSFYSHMSWRDVFPTPSLRWMHAGLFAGALFFQFQSALSLILTFSVTGNKVVIGLLSMGYTLACILALRLYQRLELPGRRWMNIGVGLIAAGFLLAVFPQAPVRVVSNFFTTVGMFYFGSVWNAQQYAMFSELSPMHSARLFTWRENTFNVSRIFVYAALFPLHRLAGPPFYAILAAILVCSVLVPYLQNKSLELARGSRVAARPLPQGPGKGV
ncbi:MFS transporter [Alicyclobacillus kakegawensis]|uniref:MFS transporter n=1 Tax=Alicyclobacillus kakegawensis TaxID=392012 RepID=UPI000835395D|nr:MFS transporter [Alicyclobacillus kakegawensis]